MRRLTNGWPCLALAALLLFARLLAPAAAMPAGAGADSSGLITQSICHTGPADPAPTDHPAHHDCLLCPACHLASHAALPVPVLPLPTPTLPILGTAAPLPPAIGPPSQVWTAAQPTGPPHLSA